ncbi:MAG: DUF86 domain-containing protein [bacterium]
MNRTSKLFFDDIKQSIEKIKRYIAELSYKDFAIDEKTVDAVVRNLEIIGEASKNIPKRIKSKYSDIPWKEVTSMRNRITHEYFGLDREIIWEIAKKDLLEIEPKIKEIILQEFE